MCSSEASYFKKNVQRLVRQHVAPKLMGYVYTFKDETGCAYEFTTQPSKEAYRVMPKAVIQSSILPKGREVHQRTAITCDYREYTGKGVICAIWPDENMPRNQQGEVADVIVDACKRNK